MSVFQYWQKKFKTIDPDEELKQLIKIIYIKDDGNYGVRRVVPEVRALYQVEKRKMPNHKKIQRPMYEMRLICLKYSKRIKKYDSSKGPKGRKAKNRFKRRFQSDHPLQRLVCDVTELRTKNGDKVYLEIIKYLYSNRILEKELGVHPNLKFSLAPLKRLVASLPHTGYQITLHTDQGWQYQHKAWCHFLRKGHIYQSMSHRATCLDNAACESFFNKLKTEMPVANQCENCKKLIETISFWIEHYNTKRIQNRLNNKAPLLFELGYKDKNRLYKSNFQYV
jgi:transposase InsO family protein